MIYNLRSDIIYYKTNSDFELEFNLCGCCRMRLLTDKPSNKKAFVHSLARAVSRSRVILIAGPLFGEESTVKTVAQALGTETEITNNAEFNIATDDEIEIIKNSIPLVSDDGLFGGCIIESGPQTMILLTDNKTLRKKLMKALIHPYIAELYAAESTTKDTLSADAEVIETSEPEPIIETNGLILEDEISSNRIEPEIESEDLILEDNSDAVEEIELPEQPQIIIEDADENIADEYYENSINAEELILEETAQQETEEVMQEIDIDSIVMDADDNEKQSIPEEYTTTFNQFVFDDELDKKNKKSTPNVMHSNDFLYFDDNGEIFDGNDEEPMPKASRLNIATIIVTAILLLTIIVICYCIFAVSGNEGVSPTEYIQTIWQTVFK